jgi:Fe2+ transport system protein FeoA
MQEEKSANDLDVGVKARIVSLDHTSVTSKLMALGVLSGKMIEKIQRAPFGGSAFFRLENHLLALRNEEASSIRVMTEKG